MTHTLYLQHIQGMDNIMETLSNITGIKLFGLAALQEC